MTAPRGMQKAPGPPERGARPGGGVAGGSQGTNGQHESLRNMLSRRAAENQQAMMQALDNVPEQSREALQQAIAAADNGYRQALGSLD